MGAVEEDIVSEALRVTDRALATDVLLRVLGGVAIGLHTPEGVHPALVRRYGDIDLVTTRKHAKASTQLLTELGYTPNERFNTMNSASRLVFYDNERGRNIDVFVGSFRMCHELPLSDRLELEERTVPLAELLLTKLQIVRLNEKDLHDIWAILYAHDVAAHDDDAVNAAYIAELLAGDWGLWRTSRQTVETARERLARSPLAEADRSVVDDRLGRLWERVEAQPRGLRWRSRAKVGDRTKWYDEPEEIAHAVVSPG